MAFLHEVLRDGHSFHGVSRAKKTAHRGPFFYVYFEISLTNLRINGATQHKIL
ncbi:hypothetical protein [Shewanella denitrificans]|uniref:hypothetical protein n=1 Tax=Shewanella denitrificans TaxID=192073 RepID=UPI0002EB6698|nr:hypothetical protein [Shewanella denitrificans]